MRKSPEFSTLRASGLSAKFDFSNSTNLALIWALSFERSFLSPIWTRFHFISFHFSAKSPINQEPENIVARFSLCPHLSFDGTRPILCSGPAGSAASNGHQ